MTYAEQLKTPEWGLKKSRILTRDNFKCQAYDCAYTGTGLEVHHLDYINNTKAWEYPDDMLISLCKKCHNKEVTRYKLEENLYKALKMKGFLACDLLAFTAFIYSDKSFLRQLLTNIRNNKNG